MGAPATGNSRPDKDLAARRPIGTGRPAPAPTPTPTLVSTTERLGVTGGPQRVVYRLHVESPWRAVVEPITQLKQRLDCLLNRNAWEAGEVSDANIAWGRQAGFPCTERPGGDGVCPNAFAEWIVGPFRTGLDNPAHWRLSRVPAWAAVGWRRDRHQAENAADASTRRAAIDAETVRQRDGTAYWLHPLPLVLCGEGKHRVELHTAYFDDLLVNLDVHALPAPARLRLKRVLGAPRVLALQCRDADGDWQTALLPFGELSRPLFEALGVPMARGWWVALPWSAPVREIARRGTRLAPCPTPLRLALDPTRLRSALLESGYV